MNLMHYKTQTCLITVNIFSKRHNVVLSKKISIIYIIHCRLQGKKKKKSMIYATTYACAGCANMLLLDAEHPLLFAFVIDIRNITLILFTGTCIQNAKHENTAVSAPLQSLCDQGLPTTPFYPSHRFTTTFTCTVSLQMHHSNVMVQTSKLYKIYGNVLW